MRRTHSGMTFLEIIIVTTILSVLAIFTIPNMKGPHAFNRLRAGSREIVSLMKMARSTAVLNEVEVVLEMDIENHRYRLDLDNVARKKRLSERKAVKQSRIANWRDLPDKIEFEAIHSWDDPDKRNQIARIIFYPDGSASDSSVVLRNDLGKKMTIELNRATALAKIEKGEIEDQNESES